jgi:hypothetical protein
MRPAGAFKADPQATLISMRAVLGVLLIVDKTEVAL